MTFQEYIFEYLDNRGIGKDIASDIFPIFSSAPENESMKNRWSDNIDDYPVVMQHALLPSLHKHVLNFIDENMPQAWFKSLFQ